VYKFLLLIEKYESAKELFDISFEITHNIKKTICSGKGGEAALKFYNDGTFICTVDSIADNIKMIEEAILKTKYKDNVKIGLNFMANNLYLEDKKVYEMENPK
jgi:enolase